MTKKKIVLALSGGMDSGVLLAEAIKRFPDAEFHLVSFQYGSKHNELETQAAANLADKLLEKHPEWSFRTIEVSFPAESSSALLDPDCPVPTGHYNDENMKQTVVPGRNTLFFAHMLSLAESLGGATIYLGVHAGDHHIYPDCRPEWVKAVDAVADASSEDNVFVKAPYLEMKKDEIVKIGLELGFPFHLTRTCYTDHPVACGECGSCRERLEAFEKNNAVDPLQYQNGCPRCGRHCEGARVTFNQVKKIIQDGSGAMQIFPPPACVQTPKKAAKPDVANIPRDYDIMERFARTVKNAATNGVYLKPEVGNELLNQMEQIARGTFKFDLLKDKPLA